MTCLLAFPLTTAFAGFPLSFQARLRPSFWAESEMPGPYIEIFLVSRIDRIVERKNRTRQERGMHH